jgi:hypothetical protein
VDIQKNPETDYFTIPDLKFKFLSKTSCWKKIGTQNLDDYNCEIQIQVWFQDINMLTNIIKIKKANFS